MRPPTPEKPQLAQASRRILPDLLAEVSGGGFAGSPDVPASKLGSRIGYSLQAGHRLECETSGLERCADFAAARKREARLKKWSGQKKEALVRGNVDLLKELARSHD